MGTTQAYYDEDSANHRIVSTRIIVLDKNNIMGIVQMGKRGAGDGLRFIYIVPRIRVLTDLNDYYVYGSTRL